MNDGLALIDGPQSAVPSGVRAAGLQPSAMPKIRIERYPVQTFGLGVLGFDHLQLVYQPDDTPRGEVQDTWLLIEGLRERTPDGVRLSVEGWEGRTTLAEANGGVFGGELTAKIGTPSWRGSREIPAGGDESSAWATMASFAGDMEAQGFPYIAYAPPGSPIPTINSSSLAASLLYYIGVDIASAMPFGARLSPGTTTLIGSSGDDHLSIAHGFTTIVGGEGRDILQGGDDAGAIDKLYGGKDNDRFVWSKGFNIVHGGQPELAYEKDGVDLLSYVGAGTIRIEANPHPVPHYRPDFIVTTAGGVDHLYSIEQIAWDASSDHVVLGKGVGIIERPMTLWLGSEIGGGEEDRVIVGALDVRSGDGSDMIASGGSGNDTLMTDAGVSAFASYAELVADAMPPGSETWCLIDGLPGIAVGDVLSNDASADDVHGHAF
jgi:hypothetical protein